MWQFAKAPLPRALPDRWNRGIEKEALKLNELEHDSLYWIWASSRTAGGAGLIELLRTNDLVLISRLEAILAESGIAVFLADRHMSALEGSLSFLPRRLHVAAEAETRARKALKEAGLGPELRDG